LELFDVERTPVHGGSILIFVRRKGDNVKRSKNVEKLLKLENDLKLNSLNTFKKFADKVETIKQDIQTLLIRLKKQNKKVVGFGAPAKGNILLNYCDVDGGLLDFLTDNIPYKHGLYTPGMHIQVFPEDKLTEYKPDYILLLPWNFKEEILKKLENFRKQGGKVIVPIPKVEII
jgi:hypothetical protein